MTLYIAGASDGCFTRVESNASTVAPIDGTTYSGIILQANVQSDLARIADRLTLIMDAEQILSQLIEDAV